MRLSTIADLSPGEFQVPELMTTRKDVYGLWLGIAFSLGITAVIWALNPLLARIILLPDQGIAWYYWKLPNPTFWTRFSAWGLYFAHQISFWWIIWYAHKKKTRYTTGLHKFNIWALGINERWIFIGLYLLSALYVYNGRFVEGILEIIRIPAIDYLLVFVLAGIFWLLIKLIPSSRQRVSSQKL